MAFPAPNQHHHHPLPAMCSGSGGGATSAPPPTPSNHHLGASSSDAASANDILSRLLHRLPPTLSLPTRRAVTTSSSSTTTSNTALPILSLSTDKTDVVSDDAILHAASQLGVFQLIDHGICPELVGAAESEAGELFGLSLERKESLFPRDWPLGYEAAEEEDGGDGDERTELFCLDSSSHCAGSTEFSLASLHEFRGKMEKIGLKIVERLFNALGFSNPVQDPTRIYPLLWISRIGPAVPKTAVTGGFYPFVVGLDYQIRNRKYTVVTDSTAGSGSGSDPVSVSPQVDSVMVTIGDIAQVWSNGKLKKARGKPMTCLEGNTTSITMSLLVTLPLESTVSPLQVKAIFDKGHEEVKMTSDPEITETSNKGKEEEDDDDDDKAIFNSFLFEDYAWRVYHERLTIKDPLDRYRT